MTADELARGLRSGGFDSELRAVYAEQAGAQAPRIAALAELFKEEFGAGAVSVLTAPGRAEIGGNHTDHQYGNVLAAAVSRDLVAVAGKNDSGRAVVMSEGFGVSSVELSDLAPKKKEAGTTAALVRGVADGLVKRGYSVGGFCACVASDVPAGAGLSTSAAFEVLIGNIFNCLYNDMAASVTDIAMAGRYAENEHFKKPCGLMDQLASSSGGFVAMDFYEPERPDITKIDFDMRKHGYELCIVNAGGSHAGLTKEYAAVTDEMKSVSRFFGESYLSRVDEGEFFSRIPELRGKVSDRAILRAMHFFGENARAKKQRAALERGDVGEFLALVRESGESSFKLLQNVCPEDKNERAVSLCLALSERLLKGRGAWRIHGGGFAGTILAFVPLGAVEEYKAAMEAVFGENSCIAAEIRQTGGVKLI